MFSVPFFQGIVQTVHTNLQELILLLVLLFAALSDLGERRVSNKLLLRGFAAIFLVKLAGGSELLLRPLVVSLGFIFLLLPIHRFRMIGGADIKAAALILFCRPDALGAGSLFTALLLGAVYSLYKLGTEAECAGRFRYLREYVKAYVKRAACSGLLGDHAVFPYYSSARDGYRATVPLAACLFSGTAICLLLASL
ncbi:MAG: prepilin peptidase [Eubacteriales bacterium]|nr:prepilin peptidase [Eubacteriales bacterium]